MAAFIPFVPKGQINIYRFVPLDETYQNTLHFETRAQQLAYFGCDVESAGYENLLTPRANSIDKVKLVGQSFTRNERQYVRIEGNACNYYDCNYMSYQNRDFGQMWFFAFIHEVKYVNDYCTEIEFEIDVMQTFMWNYELRECFVEREHSLTDELYEHLQPDYNVDFPYKNTDVFKTDKFDQWQILLTTTFSLSDIRNDKPVMSVYNGMPVGGEINAFDVSMDSSGGLPILESRLQQIATAGANDGLVSAVMFPTFFNSTTPAVVHIDRPTTIDGYTPINKRLFAYPYTLLDVDTCTNESLYKFEFFKNDVEFNLFPCVNVVPVIKCTPIHYDDGNGTLSSDFTKSIDMTNFPQIQLSCNNFANWWGQNSWNVAPKVAIGISEAVIGMQLANPTMAEKGLTQTIGAVSEFATAKTTPPTVKLPQAAYSDVSTRQRDFYFKTIQINADGARVIDDYFTMYGYACNKVKIPNVRYYNSCRPHFNYIKCRQMSFHWELFYSEGKGTSVPQYYMKKIMSIYQNGITFWKNPNKVGRYDELKATNVP